MNRRVYATKQFSFDAAHHLPNYVGKCAKLHGHTYKLEVTVSRLLDVENANDAMKFSSLSMVMDFVDLNKVVQECILDTHDHADLNNLYPIPTAEVMACGIFDTIKRNLPSYFCGTPLRLERVKLWETPTSYAEYRGEEL